MGKMSSSFKNIKKILIPIDGSDYSMRAAEYGISIAKMLNAQIIIVYVIDQILLDQVLKITDHEDVERDLKKDGQQYINYALNEAQKEGVKTASLLAKGRPFEQIVHLAKELNMDLIVMGTYGLRGADRFLIGSVAEKVIEYSPCPVLVVK
jgi:nucleotide-binding universal stress UspA family protein